MTPKIRTNLTALAVALGSLVAGYGLGEPPSQPVSAGLAEPVLATADAEADRARAVRGALKRQIAMPYVSVAALMPRQES